ncbi:MAG: hypothetical protein LBQ18_08040 [Campylobacteraceae bacterium]|jgi:hypothetical protein|nr:hypothetical protein [Campylobacteraceae bacterium]
MFDFLSNILTGKPSKHSVKLASMSPKISTYVGLIVAILIPILFVALLFVGCGGSGGGGSQRALDSYAISFYDAELDLLDRENIAIGSVVDLDDRKIKYGVDDWYLANNETAIDGNFTPDSDISFYAANGVIEVSSQAELDAVRDNMSGSYLLVEDIVLQAGEDGFDETQGWLPIGDNSGAYYQTDTTFRGTFNGNGHKISGLWVDRPLLAHTGLFGFVSNGGTIKNIGVLIDENRSVRGEDFVGGIAGSVRNNSTLSNSYSIGSVIGQHFVGGVVGYVSNISTVNNTYSIGDVRGVITDVIGSGDSVGGIAGYVLGNSTLSNSYSTASVSGVDFVGGIAGTAVTNTTIINNAAINQKIDGTANETNRVVGSIWNNNTISNNFASAAIKINGFIRTVDDVDGLEGGSKIRGELKTKATYEDGLGWSFGESVLSPWKIDDGVGYPYLYWEDR